MDVSDYGASHTSQPAPVAIALGEQVGVTIAAAIDAAGGLAWLPEVEGELVVATADTDVRGRANRAARTVGEIVAERGRKARVIAPDRRHLGSLRRFGDRTRWRDVDVSGAGARIDSVSVRRELVEAPALIGVGAIGGPDDTGPLAIGLWRRFVHPRLAIAARLSGDRAPLAADLAIPFRPRLLVLTGSWHSLTVVVTTADLTAAELTGLAIRHAATADPVERPRPWEDPLVQRATELALGVLHPSSIAIRPVWAGSAGSPDADSLPVLGDLVADALELR